MTITIDMTKALMLSDALSQYIENAVEPDLLDKPTERERQDVRVETAQAMLDSVDAFIAGATQ